MRLCAAATSSASVVGGVVVAALLRLVRDTVADDDVDVDDIAAIFANARAGCASWKISPTQLTI